MTSLAVVLLRSSGRGRALLVVAATALSAALLLVAISIARLSLVPGYTTIDGVTQLSERADGLIGPLRDPGTRGGGIFGVVLLVMPLLLLLDQAVRLGSSARHRRWAALAVAGATRADLRRWGALEVGLPAAVGGLLGVPLWLVMRVVLGSRLADSGMALVPTTIGPGWWSLLVVAVVAAYGVLVGVRTGARAPALLVGTQRLRRPPRPWGLLVLAADLALLLGPSEVADSDLGLIGLLAVLVLGLALLSPWLAHRVALVMVPRAESAEMLLALRRLVADPGPPGRAAAATGAVAVAGGVIGPLVGDVLGTSTGSDVGYYVGPAALVGVLAAIAALVVAATLAIHSTETVLERRRELAALVAGGVPPSVVSRSQLLEVWVATLPLATAACGLSAFGYWFLAGAGSVLWPVAGTVVTLGVIAGAGWLTHVLVRPWVRDAVHPANLRTE